MRTAPGMLIIGEEASGKTTLLQQTAAKFFLTAPTGCLISISQATDAGRMKTQLPAERLIEANEMIKAGTRDVVDTLVENNAALVVGYKADEASESNALETLQAVIMKVLASSGQINEESPLILALDDFVRIAPRGNALLGLLEGFSAALDAGGGFIPLITFEGFFIMEQLLGAKGVMQLTRMGDLVLLRNSSDERAMRLAQTVGNIDLRSLPKGEGLLISHAGLEFPAN